MKIRIIILLAIFFSSCLAAAPTPSEVNAVLAKYANNPKSWSALNYAIEQKDFESALVLIDYIKDFNHSDNNLNALTRLLLNAFFDQQDKLTETQWKICMTLIQKGINLQTPKAGFSALELAIELNANDVVSELLSKGADPNQFGKPMCNAVRKGNFKIAKMLLDAGALLNEPHPFRSAIQMAVEVKDIKMVHFLLQNGADPNAQYPVLNMAFKLENDNNNDMSEIIDLLIQYDAKLF